MGCKAWPPSWRSEDQIAAQRHSCYHAEVHFRCLNVLDEVTAGTRKRLYCLLRAPASLVPFKSFLPQSNARLSQVTAVSNKALTCWFQELFSIAEKGCCAILEAAGGGPGINEGAWESRTDRARRLKMY